MSIVGWTTSGSRTWQVPAGVSSIAVTMKGADGGNPNTKPGGSGGTVNFTLAVTAGQIYTIDVGGGGGNNGLPSGAGTGGYPHGGDAGNGVTGENSGGGGGGATRFKLGATVLAIAGGGGGAANDAGANGGAGGALSAAAGAGQGTFGGGGGTQAAGGAAGSVSTGCTAGSSNQGGHGANNAVHNGAGGGGDGFFGGGGGGEINSGPSAGLGAAGGGGGSSWLTATGTTSISSAAGVQGGGGFGPNGGGDGSLTITYNLAPNQPTLTTPPNSTNIDQTLATTFGWTFSDPDPGDTQAQADFQWRVGAGAWTVVTAAATTTQQYVAAANAFVSASGLTVEWQVRTTDNHGNVGPWSASRFFTPRPEPAAPTITPAPVISDSTPDVSFTAGYSFVNYQARVVNDVAGSAGSTVYADTGTQTVTARSSQTATLPTYGGYVNGTHYHIQVRTTQFPGDWSPWADSGSVTAALGSPPHVPTAVVTPNPLTASVVVAITNPGADPNPPDHNDVYRTDLTSNGDEIRIATGVGVNGSYVDALAGANLVYRYRVVAVTAAGASASST